MYFPRTSSSPSKNISLAFNKNGIKVMHLVPKSKTFYAHLFMQKHKVHIILFSWRPIFQLKGFPGGSVGKESACKAGDQGSIPGSGRSPEEGNGNPLEYSCLENSIDRGAWWATVHGVTKSQTRLSDFTFTFHFHALKNEMATHSSVLAWRIPEMEEPDGLPSMGSHRVGYDWRDLAAAACKWRSLYANNGEW